MNEKYTKWTKQILGTRLISVEAQNAALLKALEIQNAALREALDSLRRLRATRHTWPDSTRVAWPQAVLEASEAYGYTAEAIHRPRPTAEEISHMDAVLPWLMWLTRTERICLSGVAMGVPLRRLARICGCSRTTAAAWARAAAARIAAALDKHAQNGQRLRHAGTAVAKSGDRDRG